MRITNFRFSNVYGPYSRNKESAVARFIKLIMAREKITVFGDGTQTRDFLFVKDLSQIIEAALNNDPKFDGVFQLGSGVETSVNDLISTISSVMRVNPDVEYTSKNVGEVERNYANISKAVATFGWRPTTPLVDGIKTTFLDFRE